jgi:hypothetical protein
VSFRARARRATPADVDAAQAATNAGACVCAGSARLVTSATPRNTPRVTRTTRYRWRACVLDAAGRWIIGDSVLWECRNHSLLHSAEFDGESGQGEPFSSLLRKYRTRNAIMPPSPARSPTQRLMRPIPPSVV